MVIKDLLNLAEHHAQKKAKANSVAVHRSAAPHSGVASSFEHSSSQGSSVMRDMTFNGQTAEVERRYQLEL